jgi:hypothetical protein
MKKLMMSEKYYQIAMLILFLIGLAMFAYLGTFTRLSADDFCHAGDVKNTDFASYFLNWYLGYTGRYLYIAITGLVGLGGVPLTSLLPVIIITLFFLSLAWSILPLFHYVNWRAPLLSSFIGSGFVLFFLMNSIPNLYRSVYWNNGSINYTLPLIAFTIEFGLIARVWGKRNRIAAAIPLFLMSMIAGGFTETFSAMQVVFYIIASLWLVKDKSQSGRWLRNYILICLAGAILALLIVGSAPGNAGRIKEQALTPTPFLVLPFVVLRSTLVIVYRYLNSSMLEIAPTIIIPFLLSFVFTPNFKVGIPSAVKQLWNEPWFQSIVFTCSFVLALILAAATPTSFIQGEPPQDYAIILPVFFIIIGISLVMGILGIVFREYLSHHQHFTAGQNTRFALLLALFLICIAVGASVYQTVLSIPDYQHYAQQWDLRNQELIRLADTGVDSATTFILPNRFHNQDVRNYQDYWINVCMAQYYGFSAIIGK